MSDSQCSAAKQRAYDSYPSAIGIMFADIIDGYLGLIIGCLCGIVVGAGWLFLLQTFGVVAVNLSAIASLLSTMVFCAYVLLSLGVVDEGGSTDGAASTQSSMTDLRDGFLFATVAMGLTGCLAVAYSSNMVIHLFEKQSEVSFIVKEASVAIRAIPGIMLLPLLPIMVLLLVAFCFCFTAIEFLSMDGSDYHGGGYILFFFAFIIQLCGVIWLSEMTGFFADVGTAGCICSWYWSKSGDLKVVEQDELLESLVRGTCHLGTFAKAALMVSFLRWYDLKQADPRAVIQVALHSFEWSEAGRNCFGLMKRSEHLTGFAKEVNHMAVVAAKFVVMSVSGTLTFVMLHHTPNIYNPTAPTLMVVALTYVIAECYTDVYSMTVDSILMCFAEDRERHDGSYMRQYFMTAGLKHLLLEDLQGEAALLEEFEESESSSSDSEEDDDVPLVDIAIDAEAKKDQEEFNMYALDVETI